MAADILLTMGILSIVHYAEAKHCMSAKRYVEGVTPEQKEQEAKEKAKEQELIKQEEEQKKQEQVEQKRKDRELKEQELTKQKEQKKQETKEKVVIAEGWIHYHHSDCQAIKKSRKSQSTVTIKEAIEKGYTPHRALIANHNNGI